MTQKEHWDLQITSKPRLLDLNLKEVWHYRDLLALFVKRDFAAQYKQTILGPLWHFVQPVLTTVMFIFIFGKIANLPTDGIHPVLFYVSGITLWNYFAVCLTATSFTFVNNAAIFGKVYFPRIIMPLTVIISNLIRFGVQMLLLIILMVWFVLQGEELTLKPTLVILPFLLLLMAGLGFGLGIMVSSITTKYRDFAVLMSFLVQLGMYVTPIIFPLSYVEKMGYGWLIRLNPLTSIVEGFRYSLFQRGFMSASDLVYSFIFMVVVLVIGLIMFNRAEKTFMDVV